MRESRVGEKASERTLIYLRDVISLRLRLDMLRVAAPVEAIDEDRDWTKLVATLGFLRAMRFELPRTTTAQLSQQESDRERAIVRASGEIEERKRHRETLG